MSLSNRVKFWFSLLIGLWALVIVATLGQRAASAQSVVHELKPPFTFVQSDKFDQPLIGQPPLGSKVIMTETFGPGFNPVASLVGSTPQWRVVTDLSDTAGYYWGRVGNSAPVTFTNSAWSAVTPKAAQPVLDPGVDNYPSGQDSWLVYGPIDLSRYQYATLSFQYYLDAATGDSVLWGVSRNGAKFLGTQLAGSQTGGWISGTFSFDRSSYGNDAVYIAFAFQSQSSGGLGAFVRNVQLNAEPFHYVYAPLILYNYPPTPTPTATSTPTITPTPTQTPFPPQNGYYFDEANPLAAGTDLAAFGGKYDGARPGDFGTYGFGQSVRIGHGTPSNSLYLYTTASYKNIATGPNLLSPENFDLYVDASPWRIYPDNLYGIIFGASNDTFGANPGNFNAAGAFYLLYVGTGTTSVAPRGIRLDRCSSGNCTRLSGSVGNDGFIGLPGSFVGNASAFDNIHVQRDGITISVWVNGVWMFSLDDDNYTGPRKWGVFILPRQNDPTYPPIGTQMQIDFDNIKMYSR